MISAHKFYQLDKGDISMEALQLYKDIEARTNGEIYLGVVGPVRTGKSTFIKRFMDVLVLPHMSDEHGKERTRDELPQSASGKTIMTTEPKFVPKEAAAIQLSEDTMVKVRLIDCVGYMVDGVKGHLEGEEERQVKTPWFEQEIPFTKAAAIGTRKVIHDHATIGIVVTTDGSIGEIPRENYREAEAKTIKELQNIGKPFVVLVNTKKPYGEDAKQVVQEIENAYGVKAIAVNCEQLKEEDIYQILEAVLDEFPISEVQFYTPKWVEMLSRTHKIKQDLIMHIQDALQQITQIKDVRKKLQSPQSEYIEGWEIDKIGMDTGCVSIRVKIAEHYYYEMLSELTGITISGQYELIAAMKHLAEIQQEYAEVKDAFAAVKQKGYGVVCPEKNDIRLEEPMMIKQGNKYGVKIHSEAPSIHLIRANIETEIAPIVGNEQQAQDLITYIKDTGEKEGGIWNTNIFGKSVEDLVVDGMKNKLAMINEESQEKLQDTMQKIVNDSNGGMVCIII